LDELYILEADSLGHPMLTWGLMMQADSPGDTPPVPADVFFFRTFKPIRNGDTFEFRGAVVSIAETITPTSIRLDQNYPNPFNPKTIVSSELPVASHVRLVVYDILGREVAVLVNERRIAGRYHDHFDGTKLATGVYIYRLTAGTLTQSRKMILLK